MNEAELVDWMQRYIDGQLTDDEVAWLSRELESSAAARRTFRRLATIADALSQEAERGEVLKDPLSPAKAVMVRPPRIRPLGRFWGAVVAATLLLGMGLAYYLRPHDGARNDACVAVVTDSRSARIRLESGQTIGVGEALPVKRWYVPEGRVEAQVENGVELAIEGPAEFEMFDADHGRLYRGSVVARVPSSAIGFRIETRNLDVVDLGTEFAVRVDEDGQEAVHVYDGEVQLVSKSQITAAHDEILIGANQTRRLDVDGRFLESTPSSEGIDFPKPFVSTHLQLAGRARWLKEPPDSLETGTFEHNHALVYQERRAIALIDNLEVTEASPGLITPRSRAHKRVISAGTVVDVYLIHVDGTNSHTKVQGAITFPEQILGVIVDGDVLNSTDASLGNQNILYPNEEIRGAEFFADGYGDTIVVSTDQKQFAFSFAVNAAVDQVRIVTKARRP
jgi:ferric-dicitrate binding protein FerR (iron transport regulator)